jgi:4-hydroxy-tetrahydrodipicolinate reductase
MKIIICGVNGRMGQTLAQAAIDLNGYTVLAGVDKFPDSIQNRFPVFSSLFECPEGADVIIDFSRPEALQANLGYAQHKNIPIVIATTGYTDDDKKEIMETSKHIPVFMSANMSVGVSLQMELARRAAEFWGEDCDIEIVERHHNRKVDAPSGTALALAEYINSAMIPPKPLLCGRCTRTEKRGREIGIHAVRGGTISGDHSVLFISTDEVLEVNHTAQSPRIFALGALRAAGFICTKAPGFYNMTDMIQQNAVTNIYKDDEQAMITLADLPFSPKTIASVFSDIAAVGVKIDIISQTAPHNGRVGLSFSLPHADLKRSLELLDKYQKDGAHIIANDSLSKLTVEGPGMERQSGVASRLFGALAEKNIGISIITTSETKISFCVDATRASEAIGVVAEAFYL